MKISLLEDVLLATVDSTSSLNDSVSYIKLRLVYFSGSRVSLSPESEDFTEECTARGCDFSVSEGWRLLRLRAEEGGGSSVLRGRYLSESMRVNSSISLRMLSPFFSKLTSSFFSELSRWVLILRL